jgi:hypothetical protein
MRPALWWLTAASILLAACGSSKKKAALDAGAEGGGAGQIGAAGSGGAAGSTGVDAATADSGSETAGAGGTTADGPIDGLADSAAPDAVTDAGAEAPPPAPGSPLRALAVSTGLFHTCALLDNHRIKCWGGNGDGELGLGDKRDRGATAADMGDNLPFVDLGTGRTAAAVSAGRYHTCAILDDGSVKCWGVGFFTGTSAAASVGDVGDEPNEMGDHLPAIDFGGRKARLVVSGFTISCATFDDGSTWCWGEAPFATPTLVPLDTHAEAVQLSPFHYGAIALFADGTVSRTLPNSGNPSPVPPQATKYIAGSDLSGCFVGQDGKATCTIQGSEPWEMTTGLEAMALTTSSTCGLFGGGTVRCWGGCDTATTQSPTYWCGAPQGDRSSAVALGQTAIALTTAGQNHVCALLSDGGVKCWLVESTDVPAQDGQNPNLGSSVEVVTANNVRHYGAWREIDLGKHP